MIIVAISVASLALAAHDWYDSECCSDKDCRPAEQGEIVPHGRSWKIVPTGEIFPPVAQRIIVPLPQERDRHASPRHTYRSLDGVFHRCSNNGGTTLCIYVPDPGS